MLKLNHRLYDDNPDSTSTGGGETESSSEKTATDGSTVVQTSEIDIAAIKAEAYREAEAKFKKDFEAKQKKAKEDAEKQRLHEQGEFKTLLEQSQAEIALLKAEKAKAIIKNEIMRNSGDIAGGGDGYKLECSACWRTGSIWRAINICGRDVEQSAAHVMIYVGAGDGCVQGGALEHSIAEFLDHRAGSGNTAINPLPAGGRHGAQVQHHRVVGDGDLVDAHGVCGGAGINARPVVVLVVDDALFPGCIRPDGEIAVLCERDSA